MKILFLFLDGVGLGSPEPGINPFAYQEMPTLQRLLDGHKLVYDHHLPIIGEYASLLPLDANLGIPGLPQSATGQATLITGDNLPEELGYHYGPKPNAPIRAYLGNGTLFSRLSDHGIKCALLNAYPPRYFEAIESGRRMYSVIPLAANMAGIPLMEIDDLKIGEAMSADFTGRGWHEQLGLIETPIISEYKAGIQLAELSKQYQFAFFEYWLSDYVGHKQEMSQACNLLAAFDQVLTGLIDSWSEDEGLILLTSDHGNLEDLGTRRHTNNPVPALLIGESALRNIFIRNLYTCNGKTHPLNISCIAPAIEDFFGNGQR